MDKKLKDKNIINPYYINNYGEACTQKTNIIGATNIPEYTFFKLKTTMKLLNKLQTTITKKRNKRTKI